MNREKAEHIIFIVLVIVAVCVGAYMFVLKPRFAKWQEISEGSAELDLKLAEAQMKADSVPRLEAKTDALDEDVTREEALMVRGGAFSDFLYVIKSAADVAGIRLQNAQVREDVPPAPDALYAERWVRVQTRAPYHSLGRFMHELETSSPYVRVVEIDMRAQPVEVGLHSAFVTVGFLVNPAENQ